MGNNLHKILLLGLAACVAFVSNAGAQTAANYPNKPVRIIVPYPPGSTVTTARIYGDRLAKDTGQSFVIDSRPGGNTVIGTVAAARSAPDGYTLLVTTSTITVNHWTQPDLPYDTLKDLVGVSTLGRSGDMIAVHPSVPASNLQELIAYARQNPGKINIYVNGLGTNSHISRVMFMHATDTKLTLVPYKGAGAAMADLLAGNVQLTFDTPSNLAPLTKAGKLKAIAISGAKRNPILPEVPTFSEAGLPGFDLSNWYPLLAPAATPRDIVEKLNAYVTRAQASKEIQDLIAREGMEPFPNSVEGTNAHFRTHLENIGKLVKQYNIRAE